MSFVYVAWVVLCQLLFKAKLRKGCMKNYETECIPIFRPFKNDHFRAENANCLMDLNKLKQKECCCFLTITLNFLKNIFEHKTSNLEIFTIMFFVTYLCASDYFKSFTLWLIVSKIYSSYFKNGKKEEFSIVWLLNGVGYFIFFVTFGTFKFE